jgi:hypothetical protein
VRGSLGGDSRRLKPQGAEGEQCGTAISEAQIEDPPAIR